MPAGEERRGGVEGWVQGSRLGVGRFSKSSISSYWLVISYVYEYPFPHLTNEDVKPHLPHMVGVKFM